MSRTRIVFFVVVLAAVLIVAGSFVVRWLGQQEGVVTVPSTTETLEVRIVCALPVEPWVREAAKQFNQEKHKLEGQPIEVSVIPMDGLTAMGRYEREEMEALFSLISNRYERKSVMLSSNLPFSSWEQIFGDAMTAAAAIDRLVHHSVILELNLPSYRLEQCNAGKSKKKSARGGGSGKKTQPS